MILFSTCSHLESSSILPLLIGYEFTKQGPIEKYYFRPWSRFENVEPSTIPGAITVVLSIARVAMGGYNIAGGGHEFISFARELLVRHSAAPFLPVYSPIAAHLLENMSRFSAFDKYHVYMRSVEVYRLTLLQKYYSSINNRTELKMSISETLANYSLKTSFTELNYTVKASSSSGVFILKD